MSTCVHKDRQTNARGRAVQTSFLTSVLVPSRRFPLSLLSKVLITNESELWSIGSLQDKGQEKITFKTKREGKNEYLLLN